MPEHHVRTRALLRAAAFGLAACVPVLGLAWLVRSENDAVLDLDQAAITAATAFTREHPAFEQALVVYQQVLSPWLLVLVVGGVSLWVWRRHGLASRALWATGTTLASWGLAHLAKQAVGRARPVVDDAIEHAPGYSFPSGHATSSATVAITLTLLLWPLLGRRGRVVAPILAGCVIVATDLDRVFLGVHFPSDVVAGTLFGAAISIASYIGYRGWNPASGGTPATDPDAATVARTTRPGPETR
ncbi:phosphatase PAP2 family protein [Paraoerskovia sediminicola]|uniref:Phosphatase PAP2 family protein n=1 Tax=Paraoerskovia sediminicola TaxID=1138587 RepID=A0ABM8G1E8_9CELL|nr:phosphatase PAP2 family protein [Paraoerskovia sediminicola]BDZ41855.1 phosphatase PAP2 family protein [Paraoerskovia sediminicola]